MPASIRAELFLGTVYGLATGCLAWALIFAPPPWAACTLPILVLAVFAGTARLRFRLHGRRPWVLPVTLGSLLAFGLAASVLTAVMAILVDVLSRGTARRNLRYRSLDVASGAIAASLAGASFLVTGGGLDASGRVSLLPLSAHAATYFLVQFLLVRAAPRSASRTHRLPSLRSALRRAAQAYVLGVVGAVGLAWVLVNPGLLPWVSAAGLVWLLGIAVSSETSRKTERTLHTNREIDQSRRMVEALSRTLEARNEDVRSHLERVQVLCTDLGERLGLHGDELEALTIAARLHDIGKIAIPERILSKPGRLDTDERRRIQIHPLVGADLLSALPLPPALAPIVRHHHEKWDGSGYPDGLVGERIPKGARILSVVDCYDALTSNRPYRQALPHEEALNFLRRESGGMFDPRVVGAFVELLAEHRAKDTEIPTDDESPITDSTVESTSVPGKLPLSERELHVLYDIARASGYALHPEEYLTLVACRLAAIVPYRTLVIYLLESDSKLLRARFVLGRGSEALRGSTIPLGERQSGWAALHQTCFVGHDHRTPLDRDGCRSDLEEFQDHEDLRILTSTLVAPLVTDARPLGVITLYDERDRAFGGDDRRILLSVAGYAAQALERMGWREPASRTGLTDPLTGVPNASFLWMESKHRLADPSDGSGMGLFAFQIRGLEHVALRGGNDAVDRLLCVLARRLAGSCHEGETLVRFGQDLFIVLTRAYPETHRIERWNDLMRHVEEAGPDADPYLRRVRITAAHASYPEDGNRLEDLLETLDARLTDSVDHGRIVPFRQPRSMASVRTSPGG